MMPTKFTPRTRSIILDAIEKGHFVRVACDLAGVHPTTVYDWIERGEAEADDESSEFARFAADVSRAKADAEGKALDTIRDAFRDSWQAAAWYLERSRPDRWAKQDWRKAADKPDDDITVDLSPPPDDPGSGT